MLLSDLEVQDIFNRFIAILPEPKIQLYYTNNFTLAIAVMLSAQSTDIKVNEVTSELFRVLRTPWDVLSIGLENLEYRIKSIGLYRSKAKNIFLMSKKLIGDKVGVIPYDFEYLLTLPGIGRKSANVILNVAFGASVVAVDTHVKRVSNRIGFVSTNNLLKIELILNSIISAALRNKAHHWLVLHGRYICKAKKPQCLRCIIKDICKFTDKTQSF